MYKGITFVACLFLLFLWNASSHRSNKASVEFDGAEVEFSWRDYRMVAGLGKDVSGDYLVVGGSPVSGDQMGYLAVLPMAVANRFKEKYGDFRKCASPGADGAKASIINMSVIIEDQKTREDLERIVAQEKRGVDVAVDLEGSRLQLIKYYYRDEKEPQDARNFNTNMEFYFIRSLKMNVLG